MVKTYILTASRATRDRLREELITRIAQRLPQARTRVNVFPFAVPVAASLEYRVSGPDRQKLHRIAAQVRAAVQTYPQATGVYYDWRGPVNTVKVQMNHARLTTLGLSAQRLGESLDMLLSGRPVTQLRDGDETIDVVLRLTGDERTRLGYLSSVPIPVTDAITLPLDQVARVDLGVEEGVVRRYNRVPTITVRADLPWVVEPFEVDALLKDKLDAVRADLPPGYYLEVGGTGEVSAEMDAGIAAVMPIILVVIVTLLMLQLQHLRKR